MSILFVSDSYPAFPDPVTIWERCGIIYYFQPDVIHAYDWFTYSAANENHSLPLA